jgi:putative redox protein
MAKPPVIAELVWTEALCFDATSARIKTVIDGDSTTGPSPVQMLVFGLAGCMAADVVDIVRKGRHPLAGFRARIVAERAQEPPTRVVRAELHFQVRGDVPAAAVERAIALSRDRYCSVWHSLRQDIELTTSFDITP